MSTMENLLYSGLNRGGCSLMGEDITPTLISRYETQIGNTQDKLNVITYRKGAHPQSADEPQSWEQTEINDTLNAFDNSETRTPTLCIENRPQDSRVKIKEDGIVQTLDARMGEGGVMCRWLWRMKWKQ